MVSGMPPTRLQQLTRSDDRISFLYLEHCTLARDGGALTATDESGVVHIPVSALSVVLLGPGTRVTHQAVSVVSDSGCSLVWVGEEGVRYYAAGRAIAQSSRLLLAQAAKVSNTHSRLAVARAMYEMRFPGEDTSHLTMQQLRGKEGARVRQVYRDCAQRYGVEWRGRNYDASNFSGGDPINQALSAANACLYGLCHSVIVALGCSPGLGFVHTGHDRSFVFDIADLFKAEVTIPAAFHVTANFEKGSLPRSSTIAVETRRYLRDEFRRRKLAGQVSARLYELLVDGETEADDMWSNVVQLWDGRRGAVAGGHNYAGE